MPPLKRKSAIQRLDEKTMRTKKARRNSDQRRKEQAADTVAGSQARKEEVRRREQTFGRFIQRLCLGFSNLSLCSGQVVHTFKLKIFDVLRRNCF